MTLSFDQQAHAVAPAPAPMPERDHPDTDLDELLRARGEPLPAAFRFAMESLFDTDLGDVRIHSDDAARRSAAAVGADAYTFGEHIVLGDGAPLGGTGRTLVHELTHVVQQRGGPAVAAPGEMSRPGDPTERAADAATERAMSGGRVSGLVGTGRRQVARQVARTGQGADVQAPRVDSPSLDPAEAAQRVSFALFDSHGYFQAVRDVLHEFQRDMTTQLGWYAGGQTSPAPQAGTAGRIATGAASDIAKDVGKSSLTILVQGLSGGLVGAGPAGAAAGLLLGAITTVTGDLDSYRPVVVVEARKPAHQVLIESIESVVGRAQDDLRDRWTAAMTESIRQLGVGGLSAYAQRIREATDRVRASFYLELVSAYLRLGTGGQAVELRTPHAPYTGEGRGFEVFRGSRYWVESIAADEVYVEFAATGYTENDFRITRTVVPRLPSTVLAALNANPDPRANLGNLAFRRLVMEGTTPIGPVKVMWDPTTGSLSAADIPHFSKLFLLNIARAAGETTNWATGQDLSSGEHTGAVHLYAWVITQPIGQLHFSA